MYTKRLQIINYGPISQLDIELPFEGDVPKPVVLVGKNGSGKSILLSHIVNGLITAKDHAYPNTPEVETGKVFKLRSGSYIRVGSDSSFGRVDCEDGLFISEIVLSRRKREYGAIPTELSSPDAAATWNEMESDRTSHIHSNMYNTNQIKLQDLFSRNCVLYFPPNRFDEPAWLNEESLNARAEYMGLKHLVGHTSRRVINYSPLHDNQNWLFELVYDRNVFETQTVRIPMPAQDSHQSFPLPVQIGPSGTATNAYETALRVIRGIMGEERNVRFGIGRRHNRAVSLESDGGQIVPNIFQLSSGETALLNLFLSILRDFDLSGATFSNAEEVRGIVVVDEIDLHLHAVHQYVLLPKLIQMFPKVQFIVTSHSPLFALGMAQTFGKDGFAIYRMPLGQQISPEEFSEFASAYQAFASTSRFSDDIRTAVLNAQTPILYLEGTTDAKYIRKAAELLGKLDLLDGIEVQDGGGGPNLKNIWSAIRSLSEDLVPRKVIVLHDCDYQGEAADSGNRYRRNIPKQTGHPIEKGIENLFSRATLERARKFKPAFVDINEAHTSTVRGEIHTIPETWTVNEDEKLTSATGSARMDLPKTSSISK